MKRSARVVVFLALLAQPAFAQSAVAQSPIAQLPDSQYSQATGQEEKPPDPLGRQTPRGTITGFTSAVRRQDFVAAEAYMQLAPQQRGLVEKIARDLTALMDRYYIGSVTALSAEPTGAASDGLPLDRERIKLTLPDTTVDIVLVRVDDRQVGPIWLISSETLTRVADLRRALAPTWVERLMPQPLVARKVLGATPAQWIVLVASLAVPLLLLRLMAALAIRIARLSIRDPARRALFDAWYGGLVWPLVLVMTLAIHLLLTPLLGLALAFRIGWVRSMLVAAVIATSWLLWRLQTFGFRYARTVALRYGQGGTRSLLLLGERVVKVVVILLSIFAVLTIAGVDTTTALAGVGIGGVAVALGAQRSIENLLGGIFLLTDRALAVGDMCRISEREGWVEDITLRSVRLRTLEQTLLSIPAGVLAQTGIENYATRAKFLVRCTLRLRYGTTAQQLRALLDGIRALLAADARIESETARIRLVDFGEQAIELELFAYVVTANLLEFLAVREDLLLRVAAIVESSGSAFAQPTQFVYLDGDGNAVRGTSDVRGASDASIASREDGVSGAVPAVGRSVR